MFRFSLRNLLASKVRLLLTMASVAVGVAFVAGTFVLSDTMAKAFDELYAGLTAGTDVVVRSESAYDADLTTTGGQVRPVDEGLVARVRAVPGVEVAEGSVFGYALVIDSHGQPVQPGGAPTFGTSIAVDRRLSGAATIREGRAPVGLGEIVVDARTVRRAGLALGDHVDVVFEDARRTFRLVGIVGFGETDSILGATMTGFDLPTAQTVLGKTGVVDEIDVRGADGISDSTLRDRIASVLPDGVGAETGEQVAADSTDAVRDAMGVFTTVLLVFAGVSLLVGSFVIWNTFNVLVAQRRREVALLRAVGGTRRQVLTGVLLEAVVVGVISSAAGLGLGVALAAGIRQLLKLIGVDLPTTTPAIETRTVVAAFSVGVVVTCLAAVLPAWSAARIAPMEALRTAAPVNRGSGRIRHAVGWSVLAVGALMLAACSVAGDQRWWTVVATLTTFLGLVFVGPSLARGLAAVVAHARRPGWRMAARNVARSSRRAAATALALTIGLTVVAAVAVTAASLKDSVSAAVSGGNRSDLILEPEGAGMGVSSSVADLLRARTDVDAVVELREWGAQINGDDQLVTAVDTAGLDRVIDLGIASGSLDALRAGSILVSTAQARHLGVSAGESVTVTFPETGPRPFRVAGTFDKGSLINATYVITLSDFEQNVTSRLDQAILLTTPGLDPDRAKERIGAALADYPNVTVNTPQDITRKAQHSVDQLLGIVTALLLLAVVVAVLGVVNTLVLSVMERSRELGVLRAVGATRRQVRQTIRRESVLMSTLGAVTGVALGAAAGVGLARSLSEQGITTVAVPLVTLAAYVVIAIGVGVLAAVAPARRASRVDVLRAVAEE
ncbi:FtsX-like permease family protein [Nocardioides sp. MAH-18]|uniref:FtsX-like permease family protein n=1 Tax=Nocardioides agri TaxID=2682843 RepID=A0A6L6XMZ4_9ACTN|nr:MULTISPECIES: ABC transporter permease [unclassified Nocardioides]MBA2953234.1 ABC transporter permease [Nocardioides sp. CGMCC 1.13656]MVQ48103.1 FtsX-like permease family protein [Nocardioides sp. MAH-18]